MSVAVIANGTTAEVAGDAFVNSITSLMGSVTALVIAVAGIVTAVIAARSNGRTKTKQEEQAIAVAEAVQVAMQKIGESEARNAALARGILHVATTEDQKKYLDKEVTPVLNTVGERITTIEAQIPALKEMIGIKTADVNTKPLPREGQLTSQITSDAIAKAKIGAKE